MEKYWSIFFLTVIVTSCESNDVRQPIGNVQISFSTLTWSFISFAVYPWKPRIKSQKETFISNRFTLKKIKLSNHLKKIQVQTLKCRSYLFYLLKVPKQQALNVPIYKHIKSQRMTIKKITESFKIWILCNSIFTPWNYTFLFMLHASEWDWKTLNENICLIIERDTSLDNRPTWDFFICSIERWIFKSPSCWICKLKFEKWKLLSVLTMEFD